MISINVEKRLTVDPLCAPDFVAAHYAMTEHRARIVRCKRYSAKDRLSAFLTLVEAQQHLEDEYIIHAGRAMDKHPKNYSCHLRDRQYAYT